MSTTVVTVFIIVEINLLKNWGRKSNPRNGAGGGRESKFMGEYTPL